jgi:hypothetical protein
VLSTLREIDAGNWERGNVEQFQKEPHSLQQTASGIKSVKLSFASFISCKVKSGISSKSDDRRLLLDPTIN